MILIKLLKAHDGRMRGDLIRVKRNEAHALIDRGVATLKTEKRKRVKERKQYKRTVQPKGYADKMMRPRRYKKRRR